MNDRDEFAKAALTGVLAWPGKLAGGPEYGGSYRLDSNHEAPVSDVVLLAYRYADAMIAYRRVSDQIVRVCGALRNGDGVVCVLQEHEGRHVGKGYTWDDDECMRVNTSDV